MYKDNVKCSCRFYDSSPRGSGLVFVVVVVVLVVIIVVECASQSRHTYCLLDTYILFDGHNCFGDQKTTDGIETEPSIPLFTVRPRPRPTWSLYGTFFPFSGLWGGRPPVGRTDGRTIEKLGRTDGRKTQLSSLSLSILLPLFRGI